MSEQISAPNEVYFDEVIIYSAHLKEPGELFKRVVDSFGDGNQSGFNLINKSVATESARFREVNPKSLTDEFMRRLRHVSPQLLDQSDFGRETLSNLLQSKLAVEAAEIRIARLTKGRLGKVANMVWMEDQVRAVQGVMPPDDDQARLVDDLVNGPEAKAIRERVGEIGEATEEWTNALEAYDLALRQLQLRPGETVKDRLAESLRRDFVYDRGNAL